jgi:hypothetical protein
VPAQPPSVDVVFFEKRLLPQLIRSATSAEEMRELLEEMVERDRESAEREARSEARAVAAETREADSLMLARRSLWVAVLVGIPSLAAAVPTVVDVVSWLARTVL